MSETPRPDPWEKVQRCGECSDGTVVDHPDAPYYIADSVDAARAADAARHQQEIADLKNQIIDLGARVAMADIERREATQQAETIRQLQAQLHSEQERRVAAQEAITLTWEPRCATLTQERDEEARAFKRAAKDRDICRQKRVDLEAHCATLTAALKRADEAIQAGQACRSEAEFTRWMRESQAMRPQALETP